MKQYVSPTNEYELIVRMQSILGDRKSAYYQTGIGDDAAIRDVDNGNSLVITTDVSVENVHFSLSYMNMREVGYRAMVANLSDCAAMGARPDSAVVQLVLPEKGETTAALIEELYYGFREACDRWQFPVVGGDISIGRQWVIGITLIGRITSGRRVLLRKGMQPGDKIWISGVPGRSAAGLSLLQKMERSKIPEKYHSLLDAHIKPILCIELGERLAEDTSVHACMDCSDGLSKDCDSLCRDNGFGIILNTDSSHLPEAMIQLSREMNHLWQQWFYHGGEDYELLFTASAAFNPAHYLSLTKEKALLCIGECTDTVSGVMVRDGDTLLPLSYNGYDHIVGHLQ
jgi:thiamine-monophosphate kinase